jgi:hypothetical protein
MRTQRNRVFGLLAVTVASALGESSAAAAARLVYVSQTGSDASVCSFRTPCKTISGALPHVDPGGAIIVLSQGSFGGATITQSVQILAPTGSVATSGPFVINAGPSDSVVLRGLTIEATTAGTGTGVTLNSAGSVFLEGSVVDGWQTGVDVVSAAPVQLLLIDSELRNNSSNGLGIRGGVGNNVSVDRCRFTNNAFAAVYAVRGSTSVARSVASGNLNAFLAGGDPGALLSVVDSVASNNSLGFQVNGATPATMQVSGCLASGNGVGFQQVAGVFLSLGNNLVQGNGTDVSGAITVVGGN